MAIPSKPVNRLTSPRWRTTFRGDGQPKAQEYDLGDWHYNLISEPRLKATPVLTRRVIIERERGRRRGRDNFYGEALPRIYRTRVRCRWKDLAAKNIYLLTLSCLEVRTNTYLRFLLDKNHLVLSKPETLIRFERKCNFRSLEQSVNPLVSELTFNLKAKVREFDMFDCLMIICDDNVDKLINVKVISDEVVSRTEDEDMAIPSKPVNRLTSPRWHTTFRGDGQPKLSWHKSMIWGTGITGEICDTVKKYVNFYSRFEKPFCKFLTDFGNRPPPPSP
ncbi:hypothetical protein YC2023_009898 [Brassica napus]